PSTRSRPPSSRRVTAGGEAPPNRARKTTTQFLLEQFPIEGAGDSARDGEAEHRTAHPGVKQETVSYPCLRVAAPLGLQRGGRSGSGSADDARRSCSGGSCPRLRLC